MFKLPLDAYVLMIPITYASLAFMGLVARIPTLDPEVSTAKYYEDEAVSTKAASRYDNQFKQFFASRIRNHQVGVFSNWMEGSPQ